MSVDTAEQFTLMDMEPLSMDELSNITVALLDKLNTMGETKLSTEEQVMLRLIRTCFEC